MGIAKAGDLTAAIKYITNVNIKYVAYTDLSTGVAQQKATGAVPETEEQ